MGHDELFELLEGDLLVGRGLLFNEQVATGEDSKDCSSDGCDNLGFHLIYR